MDINDFIANVPPSFSKHLRELADLIDAQSTAIAEETSLPDATLLFHLKPSNPFEGELYSQSEVLEYLKTKGLSDLRPKRLSQQLKRLGFHFTVEPVWYASIGRTKRGYWCQPLS